MIIHLGTEIVTTFARLDADGNATGPTRLRFTLTRLDGAAFERLSGEILAAKAELEGSVQGEILPQEWVGALLDGGDNG